MPVSKSKRTRYQAPAKAKPKPSSRWIPVGVLVLISLGVIDLILYYLSGTSTAGLFGLMNRYTVWPLLAGFGFIAAGFGLATQWR
jgi:small-conductance mechanosensitive channel